MEILLGFLLILSSLFLIMIVLVQRGRGGGLTGALGGAGGQSAFGSKAGDVFTRITIGAASVWILLCVLTVKLVGGGADQLDIQDQGPATGTFNSESAFEPSKTGSGTATPEGSTSGSADSESSAPASGDAEK